MKFKEKYKLEYEGMFNDKIKIKKYLSRETRLHIVFAHVPGPLVHGKFSIATEDSSDGGLPHILEHAIFLGSEDYPHKGVLDKVATRCFSNGTNACTDTDVTVYEITTAGQEGFLNILPIYLEHILFPTLTDAAYLTEVHHIDGEGNDAGTVYSEMQERENTREDLVDLALRRTLYPALHCSYRFNTGGLLKDIRESTNNEKVRDFHKRFYRPENLNLLVVGDVVEEAFFQVLSAFEQKILIKGLSASFTRPWQTAVEALTSSAAVQVLFPSDEEDEGEVLVAWRGPHVNDFYQLTASYVLLDYLQDSAVSPLSQAFVEIPQPLCSEVAYDVHENLETALVLTFYSVPLEHLSAIEAKLVQVLQELLKTGFNMDQMSTIIKNRSVQIFNDLENDPASTLSSDLSIDFLYGLDSTHTHQRLNVKEILMKLSRESNSFWTTLLSSLVSKPRVVVTARPSASVARKHEEEEEARVQERTRKLGKEGLHVKALQLEAAIKKNEEAIPEEVIMSLNVPSLSSIQHHKISSFSNHPPTHSKGFIPIKSASQTTFDELPLTFHLHHIDSAFVTINIFMDCSHLPPHLLPYISLFNELLFESPVHTKSGELNYKEVVDGLLRETVEHTASVGLSGDRFKPGEFASYVHLYVKVELEKYRKGMKWCGDLLTGVQFKQDRLRSVASKCLGDARSEKKDARVMMEQLNLLATFKDDSPMVANSMLKQLPFLKSLLARKDNSKDLEALQEVREGLLRKGGLLVSINGDAPQFSLRLGGDGKNEWLVWKEEFVQKLKDSSHIDQWPAHRDFHFLKDTKHSNVLLPLSSTDSCYLVLQTACFNDFEHHDFASLFTLCYFVNMLESAMWRAIRGNGLAYGFSLNFDLDQGLSFRLYGSTNLMEAHKHAEKYMTNLCEGLVPVSQSELECARCDCIFNLLSTQATPHQAADLAILCTLRDLPQNFYSTLVEQVAAITSEQLIRVARLYLKPLLGPSSRAVVTCPSNQAEFISKSFKEGYQRNFKIVKSSMY